MNNSLALTLIQGRSQRILEKVWSADNGIHGGTVRQTRGIPTAFPVAKHEPEKTMNHDVDATQNKAAAKNVLINNQCFKSNVTMRVDNTSEGG